MQTLLFTGASGFLGSNIIPLLAEQYVIETLGLGAGNKYIVDLSEEVPTLEKRYDIVVHAAGEAHYQPCNQEESDAFFSVNVKGTINLSKSLESTGMPDSLLFISSVAVYGLMEGEEITEDFPLHGNTPYALSKIKAEEFLTKWCNDNGVTLCILRPVLIAGENPPGNLGKMVKAIRKGLYCRVAGGKARKSIIMAEDIARIIPFIKDRGGVYNISSSHHPMVRELESLIAQQVGRKLILNIPYWGVKLVAKIGDILGSPVNSMSLKKMTSSLTFSNKKAIGVGWKPVGLLKNFKI